MSEAVIEKKRCNFLIPDAKADLALYSAGAKAAGLEPQEKMLTAVLEGFRSIYGGLWVGGTAFLSAQHLAFTPNAMNQLMHKADYSLSIPLADITDLAYESGFVTGIIRITTKRGVMKLRCFGAKAFLSRIDYACSKTRNAH